MEKMVQNSHEDIHPTFEQPLRSLLSTALSMERQLVDFLPELISDAIDPILRKELAGHLEETREHARDLETVFRTFGEEPQASADPLVHGLLVGHRALMTEVVGDRRVLAVVATAAALKHAEIARYEVLRTLAESCGNPGAVTMIVRILDQERQALKRICESMHRLVSRAALEPALVEATPAG
jgi:ferritin-like metal-binding protein YciE